MRSAFPVVALMLTMGCTSQTMTLQEPTLPVPLLDPLPLRVGVRYSPEMHDFTHREELLANQQWTIHLGESNRLLYDQIFKSMFDEVIFLKEGQDPRAGGVDLVIQPSIDAFEFALPQQSRSEAYTVWIRYRLRVFDREGKEIANWPVSAYGKSGAERFGGTKAMQRAAALAMRDAAALVSMRFAKEIGLTRDGRVITEATPPTEKLAESSEPPGGSADRSQEAATATEVPASTPSEKFTNDQG